MCMLEQMLIITYYIKIWTIGRIFILIPRTFWQVVFVTDRGYSFRLGGFLHVVIQSVEVGCFDKWYYQIRDAQRWNGDLAAKSRGVAAKSRGELRSHGWCTRFFPLNEELKNTRILKIPG